MKTKTRRIVVVILSVCTMALVAFYFGPWMSEGCEDLYPASYYRASTDDAKWAILKKYLEDGTGKSHWHPSHARLEKIKEMLSEGLRVGPPAEEGQAWVEKNAFIVRYLGAVYGDEDLGRYGAGVSLNPLLRLMQGDPSWWRIAWLRTHDLHY